MWSGFFQESHLHIGMETNMMVLLGDIKHRAICATMFVL